MINPVFLKRVVLNNYKSIKECSVPLGPLTFLVGQNGGVSDTVSGDDDVIGEPDGETGGDDGVGWDK